MPGVAPNRRRQTSLSVSQTTRRAARSLAAVTQKQRMQHAGTVKTTWK